MPFEIFRIREGNFYIAVIQSAANMFTPDDKSNQDKQDKSTISQPDSTSNKNYVERR
jgi:hypothetical protein